jgi:glycolate oxidase FAD binding subunit
MTTLSTNLIAVRETGVEVREGTEADAVLGVVPGIVALAGSAEEVSRILGWANERGLKVAPCGTRTKLDRGMAPTGLDVLLDVSRMSRVIEHAAGDLTVTVEAGVRLGDLQSVLAEAGQFLAVDPPVAGTIGGLVATGDSGPRRLRYGGVRDLVLGVTFVRADGVLAKGGGKVVKNVAGYDMPKLLTGSLGTLGVIVEATFRLYPLPAASSTVVTRVASPLEAGRLASAILASQLVPVALDLFGGEKAGWELAVRFQSSPGSVEDQAARAAGMLEAQGKDAMPAILGGDEEAALWERFAGIASTDDGDVLARLISTVTGLPGLITGAQSEAERVGVGLEVRAHMGHGHALLRWSQPDAETAVALLGKLRKEAGSQSSNLVVWRAPAEVRTQFDVWGDPGEGLDLMRRVKAQFDPRGTLNPGRFVGGI